MRTVAILLALAAAALVTGAGFVYSGVYDIGADEPHWPLTAGVIETLRERSIVARTQGIAVPADLSSADRARRGAGNYDAMCVGCHLKPGMGDSEIRQGLYPQPPNLAHDADDAASQFWVIKHGIKMTAMPAWSRAGVDDETIWDMVALLQRLPALTPAEYDALVKMSDGHSHATPERVPGEKPSEGHEHDHKH
jgi:mono/diheme cytochrome c family protein